MKKIFYLIIAFWLGAPSLYAQFGGGSGTASDPYLICTPQELKDLADLVNAGGDASLGVYYKVVNNLNFDGFDYGDAGGWTPIGKYISVTDHSQAFRGNFDGDGKVITNLTLNRPAENYQGVFGYTANATIKNLGIENCNITGNQRVGGLVGTNSYFSTNSQPSIIENCYVTGGTVSGVSTVGGLTGQCAYTSTIKNCYTTGNVTGQSGVGGLAGSHSSGGTIINCYATGDVTGSGGGIGGLVGGVAYNNSFITNCYATGNVTGMDVVGGLVGNVSTIITNCYAFNCKIVATAGTNVGRIAGYSDGTLNDNIAYDQMELWTKGVQITPISNSNGKDGAGFSYEAATNPASYFLWLGIGTSSWTFNYGSYTTAPGTNLPILSAFTPSDFPNAVQAPQVMEDCNEETLFCGGSGTEIEPYLICTPQDLKDLADLVNAGGSASLGIYYKVVNDLDLSVFAGGEGWTPIGINSPYYDFQGHFDGNGKVISNLTINRPAGNHQGLFGVVNGATIKNLGIESCNITGQDFVGGLVGYQGGSNGIVQNCYVTGNVIGRDRVGGLFGSTGGVTTFYGATITNSYATCNVTGNGSEVGGLVGRTASPPVIRNCYATGNVTGDQAVSGLIGYHCGSIENCYATGNVSGNNQVGGLVGNGPCNSTSITNSYAFNCKIEAKTGTSVGRISGTNATTITNNYAYDQMELWANSVIVAPTPNASGKDGANISYENAITPATYAAWLGTAWTMNYTGYNAPNANLPILSAFTPSAFPNAVQAPQIEACIELFCGGSGTIADPYLICTAAQLDSVRHFLNKHFKLANDIPLSAYLATGGEGHKKWDSEGWDPIGKATTPFTGSLNGDGHRIIGLWINRSSDYIGLFGYIDGAVIKNVGLIISD